jgi:hypothetical protein
MLFDMISISINKTHNYINFKDVFTKFKMFSNITPNIYNKIYLSVTWPNII